MLFFCLFLALSAIGAVLLASQLGSGAIAVLWGVLLFIGLFLALFVLLCLVLFISTWFVDTSKEQKKHSGYFAFMADQVIFIALRLAFVHVHAKGLEMVPRDRVFLLVSNHIADLDPVIFLRCMPWAKLGFISKRENEGIFAINKIMHAIQCQSVNRENDREALKTIVKTAQILKEGKHSMGVFPEGYESKTGELLPFRNGVFKIAQRAQTPIVVAVLRNTKQITKRMFRRRCDVEMEILGVIPAQELTGALTRDIGDRIHQMMETALGQEGA